MSSNITDDSIDSFCAITGATKDRARFFLEASNGDIENAIGSFFEGGSENDLVEPMESVQAQEMDDDEDEDYEPSSRSIQRSSQSKTESRSKGSGPRIHTIRDENDDEKPDEQGQAFYAGGSQTSGQQILGPSKNNPEELIKNLFQKAKEHGAQVVDSSEQNKSKSPIVYGTGYRLGTGNEPQEIIRGPEPPKPPKASVLKLWKNGFNIDDGQLRSYEDPKNKEFLQAIQKGELPRELINQAKGGEVQLDMQDHRDEEYVAPKNKYVLFNDGYKLGSPTPNVVSNASENEVKNNEEVAKQELNLNISEPTTQIQVRLSNGTRLIIKANQNHKISDLRNYINRARPEYKSRLYCLMTSFPNKEITDESQNLKEADLLNAVIIQKLKE